jgi:hypothetical protein
VAFSDLLAYARFARGLPSLLRRRISPDEAREAVQRRLAARAETLIEIASRSLFGPLRNPYRALLELAGCELGDFTRLVREHGVEGALERLRAAGVYVTFEEFKGRTPLIRNGREIPTGPRAFDNPHLTANLYGWTGGSTGARSRVLIDLDRIWNDRPFVVLHDSVHGLIGAPTVYWSPGFPSLMPMRLVTSVIEGNVARRWFQPFTGAELGQGLRERLAIGTIYRAARRAGVTLPRPELVPFERAEVVARAIRGILDQEGLCVLRAYLSTLVRVAVAARETGIDLTGAVFRGAGEAPTPAKVAVVRSCGARYLPVYAFAEAGFAGSGCARPRDENDIHLDTSSLALIQHPRELPEFGITVDAFHFTSLKPTSPKLLLNVQSDDFGAVEDRACGCPFEELGLTRHLRHIRSFRKLTSNGMTLIGTDMVRILDEVLPRHFGGGPLDYQLVEEERDGRTRLVLHVHPRLPIDDEEAVRTLVLEALRAMGGAATLASAMWKGSDAIEVRRLPPRLSSGGKFSPLWTLGMRERAA